MKNKQLRTMIAIGVFAFSMNLNAFNMNEPGGGGCASELTYVCGQAEINQLKNHAALNCCAGSTIAYYDVCNDVFGVTYVWNDGSNSSCAPQ